MELDNVSGLAPVRFSQEPCRDITVMGPFVSM